MYFIGYDLGSSSVKASLLEGASNKTVATAQFPKTEMSMIAIQAGWAEQKPEDWWEGIKECTAELLSSSNVDKEDIRAIGISYQMHGLVVVDKNQEVLRPSIIWCDSRAVQIGASAKEKLGKEYCQSALLNDPGNFTASKLSWVSENEPELFEKVDKAMLPGDYIAMRMSGETTTTYSGLSEGIFFDFRTNDVSNKVLDVFGFDRQVIPKIVPTFGDQCVLSSRAAKELGLQEGTHITYRAGDQPNNALSLNVLNPGELAATAGTSGVVYGVTDKLDNDPASRVNAFAHINHTAASRRIGILLCINGTGILNAWARKNMGMMSYQQMNALGEQIDIGSNGLTVLPFGNGAERILNNKDIGAHISNLHLNVHSNAHMYRAIQEGIACSLRYGTDIMKTINLEPKVIRAGRANLFLSKIFQSAVANLVNARIEMYNTDGAAGAARAAGIGSGYYDQKSAFEGLQLVDSIEPTPELRENYSELYERWIRLLKRHYDNN